MSTVTGIFPVVKSHDELAAYIETPEWRKRCAEVRARQDAGADLSLEQIAHELRVPVTFVAVGELARESGQPVGLVCLMLADAVTRIPADHPGAAEKRRACLAALDAGRDLTLQEIAAATGVPPRSLLASFCEDLIARGFELPSLSLGLGGSTGGEGFSQ